MGRGLKRGRGLFCVMTPVPLSTLYFVHRFYAVPKNSSDIWLEADCGGKFCAAIRRGNVYATQFHPEKSQANGLQLLKNFIEL